MNLRISVQLQISVNLRISVYLASIQYLTLPRQSRVAGSGVHASGWDTGPGFGVRGEGPGFWGAGCRARVNFMFSINFKFDITFGPPSHRLQQVMACLGSR